MCRSLFVVIRLSLVVCKPLFVARSLVSVWCYVCLLFAVCRVSFVVCCLLVDFMCCQCFVVGCRWFVVRWVLFVVSGLSFCVLPVAIRLFSFSL